MAPHCPIDEDCGHEGGECDVIVCLTNPQIPGIDPSTLCGGGGPGHTSGGGGGNTATAVPTATNTPVPTPVPTATNTPTPVAKEFWISGGGEYSYEGGCATGDNIDPITTVLRFASDDASLTEHVRHHGGLTHETSLQRFRDNGGCVEREIGLADEDGTAGCFPQLVCGSDRWHVRCNIVSTADPAGSTWASCTPHWDSSDGSPADACGHIVRPAYDGGDNYTGSGFDAGKDWFWWQAVHEGGHYFEGAQYWDNRLTNVQCNGEETGSNGWANVIHAR